MPDRRDEMDLSHLDALQVRLSHERDRLAKARGLKERALRKVWLAGIEKEIANERAFLGLSDEAEVAISDDQLLAELLG